MWKHTRDRHEWHREWHRAWHATHQEKRRQFRRAHRLQSRLFRWFLGAIILAVALSSLTISITRPEPTAEEPSRIVAHAIQAHIAPSWDDVGACEAYLARMHDDTGLTLHLVRDPSQLSMFVRYRIAHGAATFDGGGDTFVPVHRDGALVGAVRVDTRMAGAKPWRLFAALGVGLVVLSIAAGRVSRRLARPLESVASAAERFGAGDLRARTGIEKMKPYRRRRPAVADEVLDVAIAFDTMAARIEGVVTDQRELLGAISHELRTPLARARIALEIARDRPESAAPSLDQIERELGDVDAILGDLLAAARAGLSDLRREDTKVAAWLRQRIAAERTPPVIDLAVSSDAESLTASIDKALLGRALHNLLENARRHGEEGAPLEVRLEVTRDVFRIAVRNKGNGFAADILPRAFDPFVSGGDAARTPNPARGLGLGLSLVRRIAEAHRGAAFALNVEDPGGLVIGADVGVELPR